MQWKCACKYHVGLTTQSVGFISVPHTIDHPSYKVKKDVSHNTLLYNYFIYSASIILK